MTLTDEQRAQFRALTDPLIQWLNANCHPHCTVIVTSTDAELLEGQCVHHTEQHLRDKPKSVGPAVAAAQPPDSVWEALQRLIENSGTMGPASREDALLVAKWRDYLRAPAVAADEGRDAVRYRWLRDRLSIEDVERLERNYLGSHDEAESVKCDRAVDAALAASQDEQQEKQG